MEFFVNNIKIIQDFLDLIPSDIVDDYDSWMKIGNILF